MEGRSAHTRAVIATTRAGADAAATLAAVRGQVGVADEVTVVAQGSPHDALARAVAGPATWFWLVDAGVVPESDALAALLRPLDDLGPLPEPLLLSSKVVRPGGELDDARAPVAPLLDREVMIAACQRRLVSLRLARWGSLLVHRRAIEAFGLPRADYAAGADDLEWTARILLREHGFLVPRSLAVDTLTGDAAASARSGDLLGRVRLVREREAWTAQEPIWFAFLTALEIGREARASRSPRRIGRLLGGVGSGMVRRS